MSDNQIKTYENDFEIPSDAYVKVIKSNNIISITYTERYSYGNNIIKMDKDHYCDKNGEWLEFNHYSDRSVNKYNIYKALTQCRNKINANFQDDYTLFITLTYSPYNDGELNEKFLRPYPMNNYGLLTSDMHSFMRRMNYHYNIEKYLYTLEPQHNCNWHSHLLISNGKKYPYIPNNEINELWRYGYTSTERVHSVNNLGLYLTCYQSDIDVSELPEDYDLSQFNVEEKTIITPLGFTEKKSIIKGARIPLYPPNKKMFVGSRNLVKPEVRRCKYGEIADVLSQNYELTFCKTKSYSDSFRDFSNTIRYEEYTLIKQKKDDPDCSQNHLVDTISDNVSKG